MTIAERIIWKCETIEQIKEEHENWNENQVAAYFKCVETMLEQKGFFNSINI